MGTFGLFASAFLAATILPFSSEAVLAAMLLAEPDRRWTLIAVATAGNTLGSLFNYLLGRFFIAWRDYRWFPIKREALARAERWFAKVGVWSLLFAWVPVVGDPLTLLAGILRTNLPLFLALVIVGKASRYALVAMLTPS